jgi:cell division protein FtsL
MHQNEVMRQQIVRLDKQIQQEEVANRRLRLEIDSLKTDPKTVERLAREQLGLARPDETVVRFGLPGE